MPKEQQQLSKYIAFGRWGIVDNNEGTWCKAKQADYFLMLSKARETALEADIKTLEHRITALTLLSNRNTAALEYKDKLIAKLNYTIQYGMWLCIALGISTIVHYIY